MFICEKCKTPSGISASPVTVTVETRPVEYHNEFYVEDEMGNRQKREVNSTGRETVREVKICRPCAAAFGLDIPATKPEKPYVRAFEEKMAHQFKTPFIDVAVHNALRRIGESEDGSKRARRDCETSVPLIKKFVDNNKEYVF